MKGVRQKAQGPRQKKTNFFPCALSLEPCAPLATGYLSLDDFNVFNDLNDGRQPKVDTHGVHPNPCSRQYLAIRTRVPSPHVPVEVAVTHILVPPSGQSP